MSLLDASFRYTRAIDTDIRKTFSRVRARAAGSSVADSSHAHATAANNDQTIHHGENLMITMTDIEKATRAYAQAREALSERVRELQQQIESARRQAMPAIRRALAAAQERRHELVTAVQAAPYLFERPRTVVFSNVRVGYQKGRGALSWDDDARVCELIRRHLPEQADTLIRVIERPSKTALAQLPTADLRRIGVQVVETGDSVLVRPLDDEIDRLLTQMLEDTEPVTDES